ncbi:MAG: N-6 DNA methylase, partial [Acidobacteriota bacterium]
MDGRRKRLGAWYTPSDLVETVVEAVVTPDFVSSRPVVSVLDPACGDGRFLDAVERRLRAFGASARLTGVDVDALAIDAAGRRLAGRNAEVRHADALATAWSQRFDLVIGNPPFLSQLSAVTTRGGTSRHGGGPYADAAVEFLSLAAQLVDPDGGRLALVLPQSLLASRDAAPIRASIGERA